MFWKWLYLMVLYRFAWILGKRSKVTDVFGFESHAVWMYNICTTCASCNDIDNQYLIWYMMYVCIIYNTYCILYTRIYIYIHLCIPYSYITCICLHFSFAPMLEWNLHLTGSGRSRARQGNQVDDWKWSMRVEPHLYRLIKSCLCALPGNVAAFSGSSKCLRVPPTQFWRNSRLPGSRAPWWASGCWWCVFRRKLKHGEEDDI